MNELLCITMLLGSVVPGSDSATPVVSPVDGGESSRLRAACVVADDHLVAVSLSAERDGGTSLALATIASSARQARDVAPARSATSLAFPAERIGIDLSCVRAEGDRWLAAAEILSSVEPAIGIFGFRGAFHDSAYEVGDAAFVRTIGRIVVHGLPDAEPGVPALVSHVQDPALVRFDGATYLLASGHASTREMLEHERVVFAARLPDDATAPIEGVFVCTGTDPRAIVDASGVLVAARFGADSAEIRDGASLRFVRSSDLVRFAEDPALAGAERVANSYSIARHGDHVWAASWMTPEAPTFVAQSSGGAGWTRVNARTIGDPHPAEAVGGAWIVAAPDRAGRPDLVVVDAAGVPKLR